MMGVGRFPLSAWLLDFPRCDVTLGGVTWPALMRVFSGARHYGPLDLGDLMVEIILTFCGSNSVEILCFFFVSALITKWSLALVLITEFSLTLLICLSLRLYLRLVMSTLSRPTSSSDPPSPPLVRPSSLSSSSSSSSSSASSTTHSLSVRVAEVPLQVEVVRGDDPTNVVERSDSPPLGVPLVDLS